MLQMVIGAEFQINGADAGKLLLWIASPQDPMNEDGTA